jgi:hypothetical protein
LDSKISELQEVPYTISYVVRKRLQIDNLNELSKEKRPTDEMIFEGTPEELDSWLDRVLSGKESKNLYLDIDDKDIE